MERNSGAGSQIHDKRMLPQRKIQTRGGEYKQYRLLGGGGFLSSSAQKERQRNQFNNTTLSTIGKPGGEFYMDLNSKGLPSQRAMQSVDFSEYMQGLAR